MKRASVFLSAIILAGCVGTTTTGNQQSSSASSAMSEESSASSIPSGADAATYSVIDGVYGKDAHHVFCDGKILQSADPKTFTFLSFQSATFNKDKLHVYDGCNILTGLDPATATLFIPDRYLKDRAGIYDVETKMHVKEQNIPCSELFFPGENYKLPHCITAKNPADPLQENEVIPDQYSAEIWQIGGQGSDTVVKQSINTKNSFMLEDAVTAKLVLDDFNIPKDVMWANCASGYVLTGCKSITNQVMPDTAPGCGILLADKEQNIVDFECTRSSVSSLGH